MKSCTLKNLHLPKSQKCDLLVFVHSAETEELLERFSQEISGRGLHELELHQVLDAHDLELQHRACFQIETLINLVLDRLLHRTIFVSNIKVNVQ